MTELAELNQKLNSEVDSYKKKVRKLDDTLKLSTENYEGRI